MPSSWPLEMQLLLLRGSIFLVLYLFVALVLLVIAGDLRRASRAPRPVRRSALGQVVLVDPGPTGLEAGKTFPLAAVSSIGRSLRNTISLDDEFLSAEHALLSWREGTWWIEDLGSKNGTMVNGVRISRPVPIAPGDLIEVGRVALRLEE
jgi:hypothetical protein